MLLFLVVQMGMPLMRRGVGQNCHNTPRQLAVLKTQGGDGNDGAVCARVCVCVFREGVGGWGVGGCEEFPMELIISILTHETGGWAGSWEVVVAVVGRCGCEQQAN